MADGRPAGLLTLFEEKLDGEGSLIGRLLDLFDGSERDLPPPSLTLVVDKALAAHTAPLPEQLATIVRPQAKEIARSRDFTLRMDRRRTENGHGHGRKRAHAAMDMTINGTAMDMNVINERVQRAVWERWRIRSWDNAHPFHVHGCSFLVERIGGRPAPLDQRGWKDIVFVDDDEWSEIVVRFDHPATERFPYMYHCHILEHEDHGMMGQFTVS